MQHREPPSHSRFRSLRTVALAHEIHPEEAGHGGGDPRRQAGNAGQQLQPGDTVACAVPDFRAARDGPEMRQRAQCENLSSNLNACRAQHLETEEPPSYG